MPRRKAPSMSNWDSVDIAAWNDLSKKVDFFREKRRAISESILNNKKIIECHFFDNVDINDSSRIFQIINALMANKLESAEEFIPLFKEFLNDNRLYVDATKARAKVRTKYEAGFVVTKKEPVFLSECERVKRLPVSGDFTIEQLDKFIQSCSAIESSLKNQIQFHEKAISKIYVEAKTQEALLKEKIDANTKALLVLSKKQEVYSTKKKMVFHVENAIRELSEMEAL